MPEYGQVEAILAARTRWREQLQARVDRQVVTLIAGMDESGWYDHPRITVWTAEVVAVVESAQIATAEVTDDYLREVAAEVAGRRLDPSTVVDPSTLRKGTTHQGAYGRLADQYRRQASEGMPVPEILSRITTRARVMINDDLNLALRHQSMRWMRENDISMYRRVIRPEMSKGQTCGLCLAASDRIYYRDDLMPMHGGCHCDVLPILGTRDPGRFLNQGDLESLYARAGGSTYGDDLFNTRYEIVEHGELGPTLVDGRYSFRGPRKAAADTTHK